MIKDRYTDAFEGRVLLLDGYRLAIQVVAGCKRIISPKPKRPYMLYLIRRAETVAAANAAVRVRSCANWLWSCHLYAVLRSRTTLSRKTHCVRFIPSKASLYSFEARNKDASDRKSSGLVYLFLVRGISALLLVMLR